MGGMNSKLCSLGGESVTHSRVMPSQGLGPAALAMHTSSNGNNEFLYVSNNGSNNIGSFTVGATTGVLSNPGATLFTPGLPSGMAAK